MGTLRSLVAKIGVDVDGLQKGVQKAQGLVKGFAAKLTPIGDAIKVGVAGAAVAAVTGATVAFTALGGAALDVSQQMAAGQGLIQTSLGVTEQRAQQLGQVALSVWKNNFGESVEDVNNVLIKTRQQLGEMSDSELQGAVEKTIALRDAFNFGEDESLNAVRTLMQEMGLSAQQAFDFIVAGQQRGLNASGDFLDSISEYSNQFAAAGFNAEQMFSVMQTGLAGGVLGTDKIADAIKEMGIILNAGGDGVEQAFGRIGLNYGQIADQVRTGKSTWGDSFDAIIQGINAIEDPLERQRVQVAIFGTMAEDLGPAFTEGLSAGTTSMEDMAGAAATLNAQYNTLGAAGEGLWRRIIVALLPVTDEMLRLANLAMPYIEDFFTRAEPIIQQFASTMSGMLGPAAMSLGNSFTRIATALGLVNEDATTSDLLMSTLQGTLNLVVTAVQAAVVFFDLLALGVEKVSALVTDGLAGWEKFGNALSVAGEYVFGGGGEGERSFGGGPAPKTPPAAAAASSSGLNDAQMAELSRALQEFGASLQSQPIQIEAKLDGEAVANSVTKRVGSSLANRQSSRVGSR